MTHENVELLHQAYDAVNRRDPDALVRLMDADVEAVPILRDHGDVPLARLRVHGHGE